MAVLNKSCPQCQQKIAVAESLPARIKCPTCGRKFIVWPYRSRRDFCFLSTLSCLATVALAGILGILVVGCGPSASPTERKPGIDKPPVIGGSGGSGDVLPGGTGGNKSLTKEDKAVNEAVEKGVAYLKKKLLEADNRTNSNALFYYYKFNDDPHVGATALAGMTLVECGVEPDDPAVVKAVKLVQERSNQMTFSYSVAISILFLDRLVDHKAVAKTDKEAYKKIIQHLALQLVGNQHPTGAWNYYTTLLTPQEETTLLAQLKAGMFKPGEFRPPLDDNVYRDNSISQFVLLSLWAARKHGIPVEASLLKEEEHFRDDQNPNGSWDYSRNNATAQDATTCAGLICLAIGSAIKDEIAEQKSGKKSDKIDISKDKEIQKGLKYLSQRIGSTKYLSQAEMIKRNKQTVDLEELQKKSLAMSELPELKKLKAAWETAKLNYYTEKKASGPASPKTQQLNEVRQKAEDAWTAEAEKVGMLDVLAEIKEKDNKDLPKGAIIGSNAWGDLYLFWSIERVAVIYGMEKFGTKDWYSWGRKIIVDNQKPDGSWKERFPGVPDTCFALLFLKKINIVKDLTDKFQRLLAAITGSPNRPPPPGTPWPVRKDEA